MDAQTNQGLSGRNDSIDPNSYRQPSEATGRMAGEIIYWLALAVTAGADVAAFKQVLSIILAVLGPAYIILAVAGFTAMSLTLAHFAGRLLRDRKAKHGPQGKWSVWLLLAPWALLGGAALFARLILPPSGTAEAATAVSSGSASTAPLAGAVLFLILYLALMATRWPASASTSPAIRTGPTTAPPSVPTAGRCGV